MNAYKIELLVWFGLSALLVIMAVGKPRKTLLPEDAAVVVLALGGLAALVVLA